MNASSTNSDGFANRVTLEARRAPPCHKGGQNDNVRKQEIPVGPHRGAVQLPRASRGQDSLVDRKPAAAHRNTCRTTSAAV